MINAAALFWRPKRLAFATGEIARLHDICQRLRPKTIHRLGVCFELFAVANITGHGLAFGGQVKLLHIASDQLVVNGVGRIEHGLQNASPCVDEPVVHLQQGEVCLRRYGSLLVFCWIWMLVMQIKKRTR